MCTYGLLIIQIYRKLSKQAEGFCRFLSHYFEDHRCKKGFHTSRLHWVLEDTRISDITRGYQNTGCIRGYPNTEPQGVLRATPYTSNIYAPVPHYCYMHPFVLDGPECTCPGLHVNTDCTNAQGKFLSPRNY